MPKKNSQAEKKMRRIKSLGKSQIYYGRNILREAIKAKAFIDMIYVETKSAYDYVQSLPYIKEMTIKYEEGIPKSLQKENHQGLAFRSNHEFYVSYSIERLREFQFIVICNHIEDVHNMGSIARCAAGFGAQIIVHDETGSASVTSGVVKASAGCAFRIPFMKCDSLSSVARSLKKSGYQIVGLDVGEKTISLYEWVPKTPIVIILGSEQRGIDRDIRNQCDYLMKIPMENGFDSLNVSHAASIALSWLRQKISST
jgi:23S rRNA (guanosine2251-2'-O)-methyltransferase